MKQEDDKVGCSIIRGMREDIAAIKRSRFPIPWIAWGFCILGFIVALGFLGRTFWPPRLPEKITYEIKLNHANGERAFEAAIKKELAEALIAVEARAANDYNDKFITLLTVLTIFGIAWPTLVALVQYKVNKKQMSKVHDAIYSAKKAENELNSLKKSFISNNSRNWQNIKAIFTLLAIETKKPEFACLYHACALNCLIYQLQLKESGKYSAKDLDDIQEILERIKTDDIKEKKFNGMEKILTSIKQKFEDREVSTSDNILENKKQSIVRLFEEKIKFLKSKKVNHNGK